MDKGREGMGMVSLEQDIIGSIPCGPTNESQRD